MFKKRVFVSIAILLISSLSLSACGGSDSEESSEKTTKDKVETTKSSSSKEDFAKKITALCDSLNFEVIGAIEAASLNIQTDPESFDLAVQEVEDLFDTTISKFESVDPPKELEEDWEIVIDDFSAMRDSYPELAAKVKEMMTLALGLQGSTDLANLRESQEKIDALQDEIEAISKDLEQRSTEVKDIADDIGIECGFA